MCMSESYSVQYYYNVGADVYFNVYGDAAKDKVEETCESEAIAAIRADWKSRMGSACSEYSDAFKSEHGFRPRGWSEGLSISEVNLLVNELYEEMDNRQGAENEREAAEAKAKVIEANKVALASRRFNQGFNSIGGAF